jgi:acyl dehydratase/putative sterol carrier protein
MFKGELDSTKAFMTGKATADNMGDLMKMAQVFDFDAIGKAFMAAGGGAEDAATNPVDEAFSHTAEAYLPEKAGDFSCTIHFAIQGGPDKTIICGDGKARAEDGLVGTPNCTIKTDSDTIAGILTNTVDPQKAFMKGKISADDMGVLMKFAMFFKFKAPDTGEAPAAATSSTEDTTEDTAERTYPIGKTYDGGYAFVRPEHVADYAQATNDDNAAYSGSHAIAPHMLHTRLFKDVMFQIATDPELGLDLLRLVHGEHDATFHRPLKPWDLVQVRAKLESVEVKSSGVLVSSRLYGIVDGETAIEAPTAYFIRGEKKKNGAKKKPKAPAPEPPAPDFEVSFVIDEDQSYRYAKASLDDNPIHVDPATAKSAGLPNVILHGLCTQAMSGKTLVDILADGDPTRLKRLGVRFARPVLNGIKLTTMGWKTDKGAQFIVKDEQGNVVIANGCVEIG